MRDGSLVSACKGESRGSLTSVHGVYDDGINNSDAGNWRRTSSSPDPHVVREINPKPFRPHDTVHSVNDLQHDLGYCNGIVYDIHIGCQLHIRLHHSS